MNPEQDVLDYLDELEGLSPDEIERLYLPTQHDPLINAAIAPQRPEVKLPARLICSLALSGLSLTAIGAIAAKKYVAVSAPGWEPGAVWQLYEEDWQYKLPAEYDGKVAGVDYNFTASNKDLRHSDYLIDGVADGKRDGWTSTADQIVMISLSDFGLNEHPDPDLHYAQPWKISRDRAERILNHGAARGVVLADGTILRQSQGEIEPRKAEVLALFADGACLDWTGVLFEPDGSRVEFKKGDGISFAVLDDACYPNIP